MATVYSLICFGGRTGKTVTMTVASPCVVTLTNHGLRAGTGVVFSTSGALPTGVTAGTTYYANSTGANTFNLYDTEANAIAGGTTGRVNTSGSQSGTHTIKSAYYLGLNSTQLARYGASGSERIYDGLSAWISGRSAASPLDEEVCEIGMAWTDAITAQVTNNIPAAATTITSMVDGVRSAAFHGGDPTAGYELYASSNGPYLVFVLSKDYATIDGFRVTVLPSFYNTGIISASAFRPTIKNMIVLGPGGTSSVGSYATGIGLPTSGATCVNNLVSGCLRGISIVAYSSGLLVANNITTKNGTGMYPASATNITGNFYNNISVGNTTNWGTAAGFTNAAQNAGLSGEAWVSGLYSRVTIATTDFASYPTDMRPALSSSPQVDAGTEYYQSLSIDISGNEVPNYNNGGSEARDIGCYEFDNGYGPHPATFTLTIDNVVVGSSIQLEESDGTLIEFRTADSTSEVFAVSASLGVITIKIRKGSSGTKYQPYETQTTAFDGAASVYVSQVADTIAA